MLCLIDDFDETVSKCLCVGGNACDMIIYVKSVRTDLRLPREIDASRRVASTKGRTAGTRLCEQL